MTYLPSWAQPTCANAMPLGALYGGGLALTGLDRLFVPLAPPAVHWMLGGVIADYQCKGGVYPDRTTASAAFGGYAGGVAVRMLLG